MVGIIANSKNFEHVFLEFDTFKRLIKQWDSLRCNCNACRFIYLLNIVLFTCLNQRIVLANVF